MRRSLARDYRPRHHPRACCHAWPEAGRICAHPGEETSNRPGGGEIVDVVDEAARGEQRDDLRRRLPGGLFVSPDDQLGRFRWLITLIDAGKILDLSGHRFFVEALRIARDALLKWRRDENLDELMSVEQFAHHPPLGPER